MAWIRYFVVGIICLVSVASVVDVPLWASVSGQGVETPASESVTPTLAQGADAQSLVPVATEATARQSATTAVDVSEIEAANAAFDRRNLILEAQAEILANQTSWFEIVVTAFGILITAVVIFFTLRFGKAAVVESKVEAKSEVNSVIEGIRLEMNTLLEEGRSIVATIRSHEKTAREITEQYSIGEKPEDEEDLRTIQEIAREAEAKPRQERTLDDYRGLVTASFIADDWDAMDRRSAIMVYFAEDDGHDDDLAFALFSRGYALSQKTQYRESVSVYNEAIEKFLSSESLGQQQIVAISMVNNGHNFNELGLHEEAIDVCDAVIEKFGSGDHPEFFSQVASAMIGRGNSLAALSRYDDAFEAYDAVIQRFESDENPELMEKVAAALVCKGGLLNQLERNEESIAANCTVIERYGSSVHAGIVAQVAKAMVSKSVALVGLEKIEDSIAASEAVIEKFASSDLAVVEEAVAWAMFYMANCLSALDRVDDAIDAFSSLVSKFGSDVRPLLVDLVGKASYYTASAYARQQDVVACIAALEAWKDKTGSIDCEAMKNDTDFDPIRDDGDFQKFLADNGCES